VLNLVFNPQGPALPPPQVALEADYKAHLQQNYGIRFNQLYTLTNMPIQRFGSLLISKGQFHDYMNLLKSAYREENLDSVMCRNLLSVAWNGMVYDCDFNQLLGIPLRLPGRPRVHVKELLHVDLTGNPIAVADHCYGCTAGQAAVARSARLIHVAGASAATARSVARFFRLERRRMYRRTGSLGFGQKPVAAAIADLDPNQATCAER